MSFTVKLTTDAHDEDFNRVIRASAVLRYMQIAANTHLHVMGPTTDQLLSEGHAFILSSVDITINRPLRAYEEVECTTWPCPPRGFTFPRCYCLTKGEEELAVCTSGWAMIEIDSRRLVRPTEVELGLETSAPLPNPQRRFKAPHPDEMTLGGTYPVTYAQTDLNHHLNNTYYPDMFTSFLNMQGRRVSHLSIRFLREATLGEVLTVYKKEEGDTCLLVSVRSDGEVNAEACITLTDL